MKNGWMIRAGGGGVFTEDFRKKDAITIAIGHLIVFCSCSRAVSAGNLALYSS